MIKVTQKAIEVQDKVLGAIRGVPFNVIPSLPPVYEPNVEGMTEAQVRTYENASAIEKRFGEIFQPNNWDVIDSADKQAWEKLISQFWVDTRVPVSKDMPDYEALSSSEKVLMQRVFVGLTMLDTLQAEDGVLSLLNDGIFNGFEISVLNKIAWDESLHNKSYSTIFQTLMSSSKEIGEVFTWSLENEFLQFKVKKIQQVYAEGTVYQKLIADVLLETFLFYSGFYLPMLWRGSNKMMNVSEIIALIIRDESVHGSYLGQKYQKYSKRLSKSEQEELHSWAIQLLFELYENEVKYTESLYDTVGYSDDVKRYLRYRANVAFGNLGFPAIFSETSKDVNPIVIKGIRTTSTNQDFFSAVGNSYLIGKVQEVKSTDFALIKDLASRSKL